MKSLWNNQTAQKYVNHYKKKNVSKDLALRIYTTHLLGNNPKLVLHGGGNSSVKSEGKDLIFFVEDDYLHFEESLEEMVSTYERIASQLNKDIFMCPSDYPYLYMNNEKTSLLLGSKRHWRSINKTLCTFLAPISFIDKYWDNFKKNCQDRHDPFEKYLNELYEKELCISPVKSLSVHFANINSS